MDINKIRFTPKANAFAEVYGKATGVPFIGELVAAAAGNGSNYSDAIKLAPNALVDILKEEDQTVSQYFYDGNPTYDNYGNLHIGICTETVFRDNYTATLTICDDVYTDVYFNYDVDITGTGTQYDGMVFEAFIVPNMGLGSGTHNFTLIFTIDEVQYRVKGSFTIPEPFALSNITVRNYVDEYEFPHTVVEADGNIDPSVQDASMKQITILNSNPINLNDAWMARLTQVMNDPLKWSGEYMRYPDSQDVTQQSGECQISYMWDVTGSLPTTGTWTLVE